MDTDSSQSRKKVLIITYYWPPSGGAGVQRFLKFAKYLPEYGIDPVILTCANPTYPILDPSLSDDIPDGLPVHTARTVEPFGFYSRLTGTSPEKAANPTTILGAGDLSIPQRMARWLRANLLVPDARIGWVPFARSKARSLIRDYRLDTVITTGPPHSTHFIGRALKRKTGIRWLADFRDPWTDIHYNRALPRTGLTKKFDARMESSVLKEADEITVTAPGTARYFEEKVDRTYHTIPNGFDPDDFVDDHDSPGTRESTSPSGSTTAPFLIRHVGSITETSVPVNLLKALAIFAGKTPADDSRESVAAEETEASTSANSSSSTHQCDIRMKFIGPVHPDVQRNISLLGLENKVSIQPYVPHKQATTLMQQADLNVVVVHRSEDSRILIPGKLYDYLKAGRPVMIIGPPDGDAADIVRKCRIGQTFDYEDVEGPAAWIRELADAGSRRVEKGSGYPPFTPDADEIFRYSRTSLTARLAKILDKSFHKPST